MRKETESYKSAYPAMLLFMFLFGALMTLLYLPPIKEYLSGVEYLSLICFALILFVSSLLSSSINGLILLPCTSVLFGCSAALEIDKIRISLNSGEETWQKIILLLILIPLHFVICTWGMHSSSVIREAMSCKESLYRKNRLISYTIMFIGFTATALLARYILIT